jgi:hypothetical protein
MSGRFGSGKDTSQRPSCKISFVHTRGAGSGSHRTERHNMRLVLDIFRSLLQDTSAERRNSSTQPQFETICCAGEALRRPGPPGSKVLFRESRLPIGGGLPLSSRVDAGRPGMVCEIPFVSMALSLMKSHHKRLCASVLPTRDEPRAGALQRREFD